MLAAPTALATSIRPSSTTTFPSNYSDVSSAIAPISYDLNSAIHYDVNSAANTYAFTNPSAADLVDSVEEWPGVTTFQATLSGAHITATPVPGAS